MRESTRKMVTRLREGFQTAQGNVNVELEELFLWEHHLVETHRVTSDTKAELVRALEDYLRGIETYLESAERDLQFLKESSRPTASRMIELNLRTAEFDYLEVRAWLSRVKPKGVPDVAPGRPTKEPDREVSASTPGAGNRREMKKPDPTSSRPGAKPLPVRTQSRAEAARKVYEAMLQGLVKAWADPSTVELCIWSQRWREAQEAEGGRPNDRVVAALEHLERIKALEKVVKGSSAKRGNKIKARDLWALESFRLEAEHMLSLAEGKGARGVATTRLAAQVEAARKVFEDTLERFPNDAHDHHSEQPYLWSRRWMQARALSARKSDQVAAAQEHWERMKSLEKIVTNAVMQGTSRQATTITVEAYRFYRLEAECWLWVAKSR
jgi:hypothetical protein